ncbi:hypothetical protein QFC24_006583 [Naganishia onofrii]|uniref:Uncharacterized protein n=1 Tax=Naganishia onofrii TaxID=1851511 RepID=A0ACC2X144_9TREE|nr:hypothetical protein QFC24_006583 [Naganishia onofrii]
MRPVPPPSSRQIPTMHVPMLLPSSGSIGSLIGQQNNQQMMMYGNAHWLPPQSSTHHIPGSSSAYTAPTMPHVQGYAAGLAYPDRRGGRASPLPAIRRGSLGLMPLHPMAAGQQSQQGTGLDRMMSRRPSRATSLPLQIQERAGGEKRLERQRMVSNAAPQKAGVADTRVRRTARGLSAGPMLPSPLARTPVSGVRNATPRPAGNVGLSRRTTGIGNMAANGNAPRIRTPQNLRNIPINPRAAAVHRGSGVAGVVGVRRSGNTPGRGSTRPVVTARGAGVRGAPVNRSTGNTGAAGGNPKIAATPAPGAGAGGWVKGLLPPYGRKL